MQDKSWQKIILQDKDYPCTRCKVCDDRSGVKCGKWKSWFSKRWNETRERIWEVAGREQE